MEWRSVHVYYYDENKTHFLLDAVWPLFERLRPHVGAAYYLPHWLRGSHVRLNFRADPAVYDETVLPAVHEVIGGYLAEHPSTVVPDAGKLATVHQRLAELEHERGPLQPLLPDNSIHEAAYDRRLHVLGSTVAADLLADFYVDTTTLAFEMVEDLRCGTHLLRLAFDLMVATAHTLSGVGFHRGFASFRSHAEAFLSMVEEAGRLRPAWQRHYGQHADALTRRVKNVIATADGVDSSVPWVRPWLTAMAPYWRRGSALIESGQLSLDPPGPRPGSAEYARRLSRSPMHRDARWDWGQVEQTWFDKYRLMLNYTYLHLTRLGLSPNERFLLCHLAANAAEDIFGTPAVDVRFPSPGEPCEPDFRGVL